MEVKCITVKPTELIPRLTADQLTEAKVVNVGIFAHGGFGGLGIRYSEKNKEDQEKSGTFALFKKKEVIAYTSLVKLFHTWENHGLMSVTFFSCNTGRPRTSLFSTLSNLFPSVMFVGFGSPVTKTEILDCNIHCLLEYFAIHSILVDESNITDKLALRRDLVKATKQKIKDTSLDNPRIDDLIFFNTNLETSTCTTMKDLIFDYLDDKDVVRKLMSWLMFHPFTSVFGGQNTTRSLISNLKSLKDEPFKFKNSA
jgi:hypothetical protein